MSFPRYPSRTSAFDRYYDRFLQNSIKGKRFRITLVTGESVEGVPTAGSIANPSDPQASFTFRATDEQIYRIPFTSLKEAVSLEPVVGSVKEAISLKPAVGSVQTVAPNTAGGGDFVVEIPETEAEKLLMADGSVTISATIPLHSRYVVNAPVGTYKYLTVHGTEYTIIGEIERTSAKTIRITVEPR